MANKVTLDFETGMITWDTDHQKGIEIDYDLAKKESAILAAMGYSKMDFTPEIDAFNAFLSGEITEDELLHRVYDRVEVTRPYGQIIEKYIRLIQEKNLAPGQVYFEIGKKLDWYAENVDPDDVQYKELLKAYDFFAHALAKSYLETHGFDQ